jgi:hypothetical protein
MSVPKPKAHLKDEGWFPLKRKLEKLRRAVPENRVFARIIGIQRWAGNAFYFESTKCGRTSAYTSEIEIINFLP